MNYIGSKYSLLPFLEKNILEFAGPKTAPTFFDIFAGTGIVGHRFKRLGFRIIANDIQYYSYCLNRACVGIHREPTFTGIKKDISCLTSSLPPDGTDLVLGYLNGLEGVEGFVYHNYCPGGTSGTEYPRQYFTNENGKRCDAIRLQIEEWRKSGKISDDEYFYLLASLIEAIDKVANTASVYGAFLKHIKSSASRPLKLQRLEIVPARKPQKVYNEDGASLVDRFPHDILYLDPPYNHRQYCTNYHVLETIARYDNPQLYGVTGLREYSRQKSALCRRKEALNVLEDLVRRTPARYVFLSYNNEGLMSEEEITGTMERYGRVELRKKEYARFRADIDRENRKYKTNGVIEYLFCLRKSRAEKKGITT
ncbi:MAG: modification methylase [Candidatus Latescibacteria bacterium]|nr:modification methylase [Candidatus Latescibacterota bacterium]